MEKKQVQAEVMSMVSREWNSYIEPLAPLGERASALISDPQDPQLRQELYRFLFSQISQGYMGLLYADPDYLISGLMFIRPITHSGQIRTSSTT